ncbi:MULTISPECIES: hypothetical protein [unclassified Rathayibacter]|uniref:hypothetical protein n=1 Tax=unclassified Rathayibacter TaxID=2609250 RepID=UPI0006FE6A6D|nr:MULTISPECIES: hypothetical protein [unclassified Rathayibacter]KQQ06115.1 hypothetical protein ASF42_06245 [Rathayibacter sp. Leaf294]KQS13972.1 hypothetical protein ASG06_06255 [Rathayibacter sp. Leaf185]
MKLFPRRPAPGDEPERFVPETRPIHTARVPDFEPTVDTGTLVRRAQQSAVNEVHGSSQAPEQVLAGQGPLLNDSTVEAETRLRSVESVKRRTDERRQGLVHILDAIGGRLTAPVGDATGGLDRLRERESVLSERLGTARDDADKWDEVLEGIREDDDGAIRTGSPIDATARNYRRVLLRLAIIDAAVVLGVAAIEFAAASDSLDQILRPENPWIPVLFAGAVVVALTVLPHQVGRAVADLAALRRATRAATAATADGTPPAAAPLRRGRALAARSVLTVVLGGATWLSAGVLLGTLRGAAEAAHALSEYERAQQELQAVTGSGSLAEGSLPFIVEYQGLTTAMWVFFLLGMGMTVLVMSLRHNPARERELHARVTVEQLEADLADVKERAGDVERQIDYQISDAEITDGIWAIEPTKLAAQADVIKAEYSQELALAHGTPEMTGAVEVRVEETRPAPTAVWIPGRETDDLGPLELPDWATSWRRKPASGTAAEPLYLVVPGVAATGTARDQGDDDAVVTR